MLKLTTVMVAMLLLTACNMTQAPAYQKDREPEQRDTYSGLEGLAQYQKDQAYLMDKELTEKCENAKIDLAIAQKEGNQREIKKQESLIANNCR